MYCLILKKHTYMYCELIYFRWVVQWIPFICKAYLPEKILHLSGLCNKTKCYSDRKYRLQVPCRISNFMIFVGNIQTMKFSTTQSTNIHVVCEYISLNSVVIYTMLPLISHRIRLEVLCPDEFMIRWQKSYQLLTRFFFSFVKLSDWLIFLISIHIRKFIWI